MESKKQLKAASKPKSLFRRLLYAPLLLFANEILHDKPDTRWVFSHQCWSRRECTALPPPEILFKAHSHCPAGLPLQQHFRLNTDITDIYTLYATQWKRTFRRSPLSVVNCQLMLYVFSHSWGDGLPVDIAANECLIWQPFPKSIASMCDSQRRKSWHSGESG